MTYENVIEWVFENVDILPDDDFQSWYDRASEAFEEEGRNSLDDILPQEFKDEMESFFDTQKEQLEKVEEEIEEEIEREEILEEAEPKQIITAIKDTFPSEQVIQFFNKLDELIKKAIPKPKPEPILTSVLNNVNKAISSLRRFFRF